MKIRRLGCRETLAMCRRRIAVLEADHRLSLCGTVSASGPNREPLACAYHRGHGGVHSWATLPTFLPVSPSPEETTG